MNENPIFRANHDGWFHVAPMGTFDHPEGVKQVIDSKACEAMVNNFRAQKAEPNFPGLLVDFDHASYDPQQPSTAAGWIEDLQNRDDGLWAKIKLSDLGKEAIEGGRYRLVSPVWKHRDCEDLGDNRIRPNRLDGVGLTNSPNIKGMRPLSNSDRAEFFAMLNRSSESVSVDLSSVPRAASRAKLNAILNYGTSEGARKGWETRHGSMASYHAGKAGDAYAKGKIAEGNKHAMMARHHQKLAAQASKGRAHLAQQRQRAIDKYTREGHSTHIISEAEIQKRMPSIPKHRTSAAPGSLKSDIGSARVKEMLSGGKRSAHQIASAVLQKRFLSHA